MSWLGRNLLSDIARNKTGLYFEYLRRTRERPRGGRGLRGAFLSKGAAETVPSAAAARHIAS